MQCPRCGTNNLDSNVHCAQCGERLIKPVVFPGDSPQPPLPSYTPSAVNLPPGARPALPSRGSLASVYAPPPQYLSLCGVCGTRIPQGQVRCIRCHTPPGAIINANDPTATNYVPFGPHVQLMPLFRAGEDKDDEEERRKGWNWGAALLPTVWAARHASVWMTLVSGALTLLLATLYLLSAALHRSHDASDTATGFFLVCVLVFALPRSIFAGRRGNDIAWRSGRYADFQQFRRAQRKGALWAIIAVAILALALGVASALLSAS